MSSVLYSRGIDVAASVRHGILSPLFSGPLLLAVTQAPDLVRNVMAAVSAKMPYIPELSASNIDLSTATNVLRILFALSLVRQLNKTFNAMASNSWRVRAGKGWDWPNEIAVVTGGSSGIGKDVVERLTKLGVRVAVIDIQGLPKSLETDARVRFFQCDVTSSESVASAAEAIRRELGHPTILINNAGIAKPMPILNMPDSYLRRIFGVNTLSHWYTTQQFLPHMIQINKGHIFTVASIASFVALPCAADYSATKASALAFHESLRCELKHVYKSPNVLTTVVHPNFVSTPLVADFEDHLQKSGVHMLKSEQIADPIVAQLKSRRGGQLIIPESASLIASIRGWPTWLQEGLRDLLGSNTDGMP
ncbi:NAD(P)-binding protein [Xylariaceae sp. FL0255]|nr:NAD(P)-binding protein [Xylariaceae sp. FL0255]